MAENIFSRNPMDDLLNETQAAQAPKDAQSGIEDVARKTRVPANFLMAFTEAAGAQDDAGKINVASRIGDTLAPRLQAGESIEDIVKSLAGDEKESTAFLDRAYKIADELYPAPKDDSQPGMVEDMARSFGGSLVKGIGSGVEALGLATEEVLRGGRAAPMEAPGPVQQTGKALGGLIRSGGEALQSGISEESKQAIKDSSPDGDLFDSSTWTLGKNPSLKGYALLATDVLGSFAPVVATAIATRGSSLASGTVGGLMGMGAGAETGRDIVLRAAETVGPDGRSLLEANSAFYRDAIAEGKSREEALALTVAATERMAGLFTLPISAFGGAATGKILGSGINALASKGPVTRILGHAAASSLEEGVQEAAETVASRFGTQTGAKMDLDLTNGTFGDFILGALGGSLPGAVSGGFHAGGREEPPAEQPGAQTPPQIAQTPGQVPAEPAKPFAATGGEVAAQPIQPFGPAGGQVAPPVDDETWAAANGAPIQTAQPAAPVALKGPTRTALDAAPSATFGPDAIGADVTVETGGMTPFVGKIVKDNGVLITVRDADGEEIEIAHAQLDRGDVVIDVAPAQVAAVMPTKPDAERTTEDALAQEADPFELAANIGRPSLSQQASAKITPPAPATTPETSVTPGQVTPEDALRRMTAIEAQADRDGWTPRLRLKHDELRQIAQPVTLSAEIPSMGEVSAAPAVESATPLALPAAGDQTEAQTKALDGEIITPEDDARARQDAAKQSGFDMVSPPAPSRAPWWEAANKALRDAILKEAGPAVEADFRRAVVWDKMTDEGKRGLGDAYGRLYRSGAIENAGTIENPQPVLVGKAEPAPQIEATPAVDDSEPAKSDRQTDLPPADAQQTAPEQPAQPELSIAPIRTKGSVLRGWPKERKPNVDGVLFTWEDAANGWIFARKHDDKVKAALGIGQEKKAEAAPEPQAPADQNPVKNEAEQSQDVAPEAPAEAAADQEPKAQPEEAPAPIAEEAANQPDPNPTDAQKEAGNYKMRHVAWNGLDITIETAKGQERSGKDTDGETWSVTMPADYGYFKGTVGADSDHVDVYMGRFLDSDLVVVVDQVDAETRAFDEHKVLIGFRNRKAALDTYVLGFSDGKGRDRIGGHKVFTVDEFKALLADTEAWKKPLSRPMQDAAAQDTTAPAPVEPAPVEPAAAKPAAPATRSPADQFRETYARSIEGMRENEDLASVVEYADWLNSLTDAQWQKAATVFERSHNPFLNPISIDIPARRAEIEAAIAEKKADAGLGPLRPGYERIRDRFGEPTTDQARMTEDGYVIRRQINTTTITDPKGRGFWSGRHDVSEDKVNEVIEGARKPDVAMRFATTPAPAPETTTPAPKKSALSDLSQKDQDRAALLRARIAERMRTQMNSGIDPELLKDAVELVGIYIKAGMRKFRALVDQVAGDMGLKATEIEPWARASYNQARDDMELAGEDVSDMDDSKAVLAEVKALRAEASQPATERATMAAQDAGEAEGDEQGQRASTGEMGQGREPGPDG